MIEKSKNVMPGTSSRLVQEKVTVSTNQLLIEGLKVSMQKLLERLLPSIEAGEYSLIIGIDSSGRLPTIILNKVIKNIYRKKGYEIPKIIFMPGNVENIQGFTDDRAKTYLQSFIGTGKVLIVEDTTIGGRSIKKLTQLLREMQVSFDVAIGALANRHDVGIYVGSLKEEWGVGIEHMFFGDFYNTSPVNAKHSISGVIRDSKKLPFRSIKQGEKMIRHSYQGGDKEFQGVLDRETVVSARQDADKLVDELLEWCNSKRNIK